ncbi:MAG: TadE family protein [Ruminococcus sp.]
MKENPKGSMTVEAAFVVPVILMAVFALLMLTMYVHNRAWYTAVSAEAVISGSTEGIRSSQKGKEIVTEKMAERKGKQGFPAGKIEMIVASAKDYARTQTQVASDGVMGIGSWKAEITEKSSFIKPVSFIRNMLALEAWKEEIDDGS